jgi:hypothetical protein
MIKKRRGRVGGSRGEKEDVKAEVEKKRMWMRIRNMKKGE